MGRSLTAVGDAVAEAPANFHTASLATERLDGLPSSAFPLRKVPAAAALLDVSPRWLYQQIHDGRFPAVVLGDPDDPEPDPRLIRVRADHLAAYIDDRTTDRSA
jgi:hypothetical protein